MLFSLKQALSSIKSSLFTTVFLLLTFVGGFLVMFVATGFADAFFSDMDCYRYGDDGDYYVSLGTRSEIVTSDEYTRYYFSDNADGRCYVNAVERGFEREFHNRLLDGRYFSDAEYSGRKLACMVEVALAEAMGYSVGDVCSVMDRELEIVGIVKTNAWLGNYIIPRSVVAEMPNSESYLMNCEIVVNEPPSDFDLPTFLGGLTDSSYTVSRSGYSSDVYRDIVISSLGKISVVMLVAVVILLYALINLINIAEFRRDAKSKELGIRFALGANFGRIFRETFLEYLILMLAAIALLFAASPLVALLLKDHMSWSVGALSLVGLPTLAALFALVIAEIITEPLKKYDSAVIDLITDRWRAK